MIEKGQIYILKKDTKIVDKPEAQRIRIENYVGAYEERLKIQGVWEISIRDEAGDWVKPPITDVLFSQQISNHYDLDFEPLQPKSSRLADIED